jgi:hypothetical protein
VGIGFIVGIGHWCGGMAVQATDRVHSLIGLQHPGNIVASVRRKQQVLILDGDAILMSSDSPMVVNEDLYIDVVTRLVEAQSPKIAE